MSNDKAPDTEQVLSADIIDDADEATRIALDPEHALERVAFWKAMAFEADKRVKELEAECARHRSLFARAADIVREKVDLARAADNELAHAQRDMAVVYGIGAGMTAVRCVNNARAALTKCLEGWE